MFETKWKLFSLAGAVLRAPLLIDSLTDNLPPFPGRLAVGRRPSEKIACMHDWISLGADAAKKKK